MQSYLPVPALAFRDLYAHVEHLLRRNGYMRPDADKALVNWIKFAKDLGNPFFKYVREAGSATSLITEPPRAYYRDGWGPKHPKPITNVADLFVRGVCQVRHNIEHGEKYILQGDARDDALVKEAYWVLVQATLRHPEAKRIFVYLKLGNTETG